MKNTYQVGDRVAYSAKFLRSICDYSHDSASMRGTVTSVKQYAGMKFPVVSIDWDGRQNDETSGALACNLVKVAHIAAESVL